MVTLSNIKGVFGKAAYALRQNSDYLIELDQQVGDGDLGITARKIADTLDGYIAQQQDESDLGKYIMGAGMKINSAAPSTMGSLIAIALMRAGAQAKGAADLSLTQISEMLKAAVQSIYEKGKANLGDKTMLDALHPAVEAFASAISIRKETDEVVREMIVAAEKGMDEVTPMRNKVGRASWLGERTEGKVDPGCALVVIVLKSLLS